jgi:hypothetical protein
VLATVLGMDCKRIEHLVATGVIEETPTETTQAASAALQPAAR